MHYASFFLEDNVRDSATTFSVYFARLAARSSRSLPSAVMCLPMDSSSRQESLRSPVRPAAAPAGFFGVVLDAGILPSYAPGSGSKRSA